MGGKADVRAVRQASPQSRSKSAIASGSLDELFQSNCNPHCIFNRGIIDDEQQNVALD